MSLRMFDYFSSRLRHLRLCHEHCKQHKAVAVVAIIFGAYELTGSILPFIELPPMLATVRLPKVPLAWAAVIVVCAALFIVIEGSYRMVNSGGQAAPSPELLATDPRVYATATSSRQDGYERTTFTLHNQGGSPAHNVRIAIDGFPKIVSFPALDNIAVEAKAEVLPTINGYGVFQKNDIVGVVIEQWNVIGESTEEYTVHLTVSYTNFSGHRTIESTAKLSVFPIQASMMRRGHLNTIPPGWREIEVKDTTFKVVQ